MSHNYLVQNLATDNINEYMSVIVEDNIGEGIHVHLRVKGGPDFRMDFTVGEFRHFVSFVEQVNEEVRGMSG